MILQNSNEANHDLILQYENDVKYNSRMYNLCVIMLILLFGSYGMRTLLNVIIISVLAYSSVLGLEGLRINVKRHKIFLSVIAISQIILNIIAMLIN